MGVKSIKDIDLVNKKVLVRVDFNVPVKEGKITDATRIIASIPTIEYILSQKGATVILMSHLGRPKGGEKKPEFSLAPVAKKLSELMGRNVTMAPDCIGDAVEKLIKESKPGDIILLENVRFYKDEEANNPEFAKKLAKFGEFIKKFGYSIKTTSDRTVATSLNSLLAKIKGKKEENMLGTLALRSMAKADYSTDNIGHYGLGFKYYSHFTSPIRRYPDMMAHRLLQYYLEGEGDAPDKNRLEALCRQSSAMERRAVEAERTSIKYKQVEFMHDKVGQRFTGVISGVTEWGIYVELDENKCEGMIPIRFLDDDFYQFDEDNYLLAGRKSGKKYQLGDSINIKIARANLEKRQLDFALDDEA
jgi:hypothetical protein